MPVKQNVYSETFQSANLNYKTILET